MSTENDNKPASRIEVGIGHERTSTVEVGADGKLGKATDAVDNDGTILDVDDQSARPVGVNTGEDTDADKEKPESEKQDGDDAQENGSEEEGDDEGGDKAPEADPGEYNPDDADTVARFEERYWTRDEDGNPTSLNLDPFTVELEASLAAVKEGKAEKPDISAGGRAYLKDKLGLSDAAIDQHIAGVIAVSQQRDTEFYALSGGKEAYEARYAWAKDNYSQSQKDRFNAALESGDKEAIEEQLLVLQTRFEAAGGKVPGVKRDAGTTKQFGKPKRPASPQRSATEKAAAGGAGPEPFANLKEHQRAQAEAIASRDPAKIAEVRARLKASPKLWRGGQS